MPPFRVSQELYKPVLATGLLNELPIVRALTILPKN
jgi:hypothetical protein